MQTVKKVYFYQKQRYETYAEALKIASEFEFEKLGFSAVSLMENDPEFFEYLIDSIDRMIRVQYECECYACRKLSYCDSIILCLFPQLNNTERIYIPNKRVRAIADDQPDPPMEVWFCSSCMRKIEDNLRATVLYLQSESKLLNG